ncbi:MAG: hypothetical protein ACLS9K_01645 [Lachnospira eligens]
MLALRFLEDYAIRLGKPLIIIFGLGSANGSRTGISSGRNDGESY